MKVFYVWAMVLLSTLYVSSLNAQATDLIVHTASGERQIESDLDISFNDWLYIGITYIDSTTNKGGLRIKKSVDRGFTWTTIRDYTTAAAGRITTVDIAVAGTQDTADLKLFVSYIERSNTNNYFLKIDRYNGVTNAFETNLVQHGTGTRQIYDVAISDDYNGKFGMPGATTASPFSIACIYSCASTARDSIVYMISANGGISFQTSAALATTTSFFRKVAVDFGRSPAQPTGKYYFAWEQIADPNEANGHIFTTRTGATITSAAPTTRFCLDSVSPITINKCRNPSIGVMHNDYDVGTSYAGMVMVEVDSLNDGNINIKVFNNQNITSTNAWTVKNVANTLDKEVQPKLIHNITFAAFLGVYLNATTQKLVPIQINELGVVSNTMSSYNDQPNLSTAFPTIVTDFTNADLFFTWTRQPTANSGIVMFDSDFRKVRPQLFADTICSNETYNFNGRLLNSQGIYRDTFVVATGDSISTLQLRVNNTSSSTLALQICPGDTFFYNGEIFTTATSTDVVLQNRAGCDSTVSLSLSFFNVPTPVVTLNGNVLSTPDVFDTYQWQLNGSDIVGAETSTLTVFVGGNYTVRGTTANGCNANSQVFTHTISGINDLLLQNIKVFPNPASNMLYIEGEYKDLSLTVTDLSGREMMQGNISTNGALNIAQMAAGTYILKLAVDGKTALVKFNKL